MAYTEDKESLKAEQAELLSLCPRGWAWLVGDCNFAPDHGGCDDCQEPLAPILIEARKKGMKSEPYKPLVQSSDETAEVE